MTSQPVPIGEPIPLHRRSIEYEAFDAGESLLVVGRLRDSRPWAEGGHSIASVHDMELRVTVRISDMTITEASANMHTFPHAECPGIVQAFKDLAGLSVARGYTRALAEQLAEGAKFPVREAEAGVELRAGAAWLAAGDQHLFIDSQNRLALTEAPLVNGVRPAADVTLASVAQQFGARSLGVILTGMGKDGARGLAEIKAAGGVTLAQDRSSSTVYGMPKAAVELGVVDTVAPLSRMASLINRWVSEG